MSPPQPSTPSPTQALSTLTPETSHSIFLSTLTKILTSWQSGLLHHEHPTQTTQLPNTILNLLSTLPNHPWQTLNPTHIQFLQTVLLKTLIESPEIYNNTLPSIIKLLNLHPPTRAVQASTVFLTLRMRDSDGLAQFLYRDSSPSELVSAHLGRLLNLVSDAITRDTREFTTDVIPGMQILQALLEKSTQQALQKYVTEIRELIYPLLEHPSVETRLPGLGMMTLVSERCGVIPGSVEFLKTSLLWNDPGSAVMAIPLLIMHLPYLDFGERVVVEKRILECVITLSTAYKDRYPCVESILAVIKLLPCMDELVSCNGVRYLCAMGAFLARVGGLVPGGSLEKICVINLCEAVVKGVKRWWICCDGFRADVFKGCLVCFMEIEDVVVEGAVRDVILTLAKCHPGRMRRLVQDLRESVRGFAGMGRVVTFLEEVEDGFVDVKDMKRVETGRLVERFFPEVNEFNLTR